MFMTNSWLKNEEEEIKRDAEEATSEEAEIKKRKEESEILRLTGFQKNQQIIEQINNSRGSGLEKAHQ